MKESAATTRPSARSPSGLLRLLVGAASAAVASLSLINAPTWPLLMLRIGATEWGHMLAALALTPLLPGWRRSWSGRLSAALGLAAALLALAPLRSAARIASRLPAQLTEAFGDTPARAMPGAPARPAPLVAADLLRGVATPSIRRDRRTYLVRGSQPLQLDLYQPRAATGPIPGVIVIHGGAWQSGDSMQLAPLNRYLAARGYLVAAINYRFAPQHRFPAARNDVLAALDYLKANATRLGLDADRIALLGRSAGGQLALLVAYTAGDPAIRGVVAFYAPIDMRYGYVHQCAPSLLDSRGVIGDYLGGSPDQIPEIYDAASPIAAVGPTTPPTLLIQGQRDEMVSPTHSELLATRLGQAGRPHLLLRLPWATHGCDANFSGPSGQISAYAVERFLAATLRETRSPE